ncbi:MAG TPA: ABC transporter permease [Caulobacteraceae bacterium]
MSMDLPAPQGAWDYFDKHRRILWALLMRELSTRYGRDNIGYLWVIVEHMCFAGGVAILWLVIRPPYEHGVKVLPFVITGYLPLILMRQTMTFAVTGVKVNSDLLYHRMITPLHIMLTRCAIEIIGISMAFVVIGSALMLVGVIPPFQNFLDLGYVYTGWFVLAWMSTGMALILASLGEIFEFVERLVQVTTYILVPISGAYYMAAWVPAWARPYMLALPFVHCFEIIRHGFFGEFITTYFNMGYAIAWAAIFTFIGLALALFVRNRVEVQ